MKKLIFSAVVGVLVAASANAKEPPVDVNKSGKQASSAVGGTLGQIGKAIGPAVGKVDSAIGGTKQSGGKKSEKADK